MMSIEDRTAIVDVVYRYATAIDERDWSLLRTCWADDAVTDYGDIGSWSSGDEITAFMVEAHVACADSLHRITNPVVWVEGDRLRSRAYVDAVLLFRTKAMRAIGRYEDEWEEVDGVWRIRSRRYRSTYQRLGPIDEVL
jgi:3-phenylpropionate/cinnamic acid dioxygenase small subunit